MVHHWPKEALHSSLFGPDGAFNYDYIFTNSIKSLLIGSRYILNGAHTKHCLANLTHASKLYNYNNLYRLTLFETIIGMALDIGNFDIDYYMKIYREISKHHKQLIQTTTILYLSVKCTFFLAYWISRSTKPFTGYLRPGSLLGVSITIII